MMLPPISETCDTATKHRHCITSSAEINNHQVNSSHTNQDKNYRHKTIETTKTRQHIPIPSNTPQRTLQVQSRTRNNERNNIFGLR